MYYVVYRGEPGYVQKWHEDRTQGGISKEVT